MHLIPRGTELSRDNLIIRLSNDKLQPINVDSVSYTILTMDGMPLSGLDLPAISQGDGTYYAPFNASVPNGNYICRWTVTVGNEVYVFNEGIFIVDKYTYVCSPGSPYCLKPEAIPDPRGKTFLSGQQLTPDDLRITFRDSVNNVLTDPYLLYWTLFNSNRCAVTPKQEASRFSTGIFWANWLVTGESGDYEIRWDYKQNSNSAINTAILPFSIINTKKPEPVEPVKCVQLINTSGVTFLV